MTDDTRSCIEFLVGGREDHQHGIVWAARNARDSVWVYGGTRGTTAPTCLADGRRLPLAKLRRPPQRAVEGGYQAPRRSLSRLVEEETGPSSFASSFAEIGNVDEEWESVAPAAVAYDPTENGDSFDL